MNKIILLCIIACFIISLIPEKVYKEVFISLCTKIIIPPILPGDTSSNLSQEIFIAHAGGPISKNIYTNSKESVLRECPAYTLLYQFSPKDTGQSKVK